MLSSVGKNLQMRCWQGAFISRRIHGQTPFGMLPTFGHIAVTTGMCIARVGWVVYHPRAGGMVWGVAWVTSHPPYGVGGGVLLAHVLACFLAAVLRAGVAAALAVILV